MCDQVGARDDGLHIFDWDNLKWSNNHVTTSIKRVGNEGSLVEARI